MVIQSSAIYALPHLRSFTVANSETLAIQDGGLKIEKARLHSLRITAIHDVEIKSLAVQGRWENTSTITIRNITNLFLEENSFGHESTSIGPTIEITDIGRFVVGQRAFAGPVNLLSVARVGSAIQWCSDETFGGRIHQLILDSVTIKNVRTGCFQGSGALAGLSIYSCDLEYVYRGAFSGEIDDVRIDFSRINQVFELSFDISVSRLSITDSLFTHLIPGSLSIAARDSITLDHVRVGRLVRGALTGLRTAEDVKSPAALTVRSLQVIVAENGSLAFNTNVSVCLSELRIDGRRRRPCPVEPLVRQLVGGDDGKPLSAAQIQVYRQLRRPAVCDADRQQPVSDGTPGPDCGTGLTPSADRRQLTPSGPPGSSSDTNLTTSTGPYLVVVVILALLSAALLAALVILLIRGRGRHLCTSRIPLSRRFAARASELHLDLGAPSGSRSTTGAYARVVTAARPDILTRDSPYSTIPALNTTEESQGTAAATAAPAVSGGLPPSCAGLYAEVGGKDLLPSPGTDDRSEPSTTGDGPEPPALPPVTMERLQVPGGGQEAGYQEVGPREAGLREVGPREVGLQEAGYEAVGYHSADHQ